MINVNSSVFYAFPVLIKWVESLFACGILNIYDYNIKMQAAIGDKIEFKQYKDSPSYKGEVIGFCVKLGRTINGGTGPQSDGVRADYALILPSFEDKRAHGANLLNYHTTITGFLAPSAGGGRRKTHRKSKSARKTHHRRR